MSVLKSSSPWVASVSLAATCIPWSSRAQVALLLQLPHLHLGLGQRIPMARPHHVLHWPLLFHIEMKHIVQVTHENKNKKKKKPKPITNNKKMQQEILAPSFSSSFIISRKRQPTGSDSCCHGTLLTPCSRKRTATWR